MNTDDKRSIYQIVTETVVKFIDENQQLPWQLPWKRYETEGIRPKNIISKRPYNGINAILLGFLPYNTPFWGTIRQINQLGGRVRKGEHGMPVVYWHEAKRKEDHNEEEDGKRKGFFLRYSRVFNLQQTEGIDYRIPELAKLRPEDQIENCEQVIKGFLDRPKLQHGHDRACYYVQHDLINMPRQDAFSSKEEYYMTLFHEEVHASGHISRLNRDCLMKAKDEEALILYGKEELIAELGASFLAAETGIEKVSFRNSAAYVQFWKGAIQADTKLLIQAASQAQKACDYILGRVKDETTGDSSIGKDEARVEA